MTNAIKNNSMPIQNTSKSFILFPNTPCSQVYKTPNSALFKLRDPLTSIQFSTKKRYTVSPLRLQDNSSQNKISPGN